MDKKTLQFFEKSIQHFFQKHGRAYLPWRKENMTPYAVWVSEIMLQQTQVDRVIDFYVRFLERFPTVESLAKSSWEEFLPYYQGLGYYNRGRNMLKASQKVVDEFGGEFPRDVKKLQSLPGVGLYTAQAIMSFAYGENHLAWDVNLQKVFGRFFYGTKDAEIDKNLFEKSLHANKRDFNGAMMDFGSLVCLKKPVCENCPLRVECVYFKTSGAGEKTDGKASLRTKQKPTKTILALHENHKLYFSSDEKKYRPFTLPKGVITRAEIKKHFHETYHLVLSVRPPYRQEGAIQYVRAQILHGKHNFKTFTKKEIREHF